MRLLADECLDGRLLEGLRRGGHHVVAVRDHCRGAGDREILDLARQERRVLVTEDKGFGELILRRGRRVPGVVLVRYAQRDVRAVLERLLLVLDWHGERLHEMYAVVTPGRARVRKLHGSRMARS